MGQRPSCFSCPLSLSLYSVLSPSLAFLAPRATPALSCSLLSLPTGLLLIQPAGVWAPIVPRILLCPSWLLQEGDGEARATYVVSLGGLWAAAPRLGHQGQEEVLPLCLRTKLAHLPGDFQPLVAQSLRELAGHLAPGASLSHLLDGTPLCLLCSALPAGKEKQQGGRPVHPLLAVTLFLPLPQQLPPLLWPCPPPYHHQKSSSYGIMGLAVPYTFFLEKLKSQNSLHKTEAGRNFCSFPLLFYNPWAISHVVSSPQNQGLQWGKDCSKNPFYGLIPCTVL